MTNKTLQEELERLMDAYWGKSGHNLPVKRPIYSAAIVALFQSRLDSIEWPEVEPSEWNDNKAKVVWTSGYKKGVKACQQAVKKAFGEIS